MARAMMKRCAAVPHASAGTGAASTRMQCRRSHERFSHTAILRALRPAEEMDNVTHTLFALTLARTPLARAGRGTAVALVLASNAPDIDIVATIGGAPSYLTWHRGPTHGPLGIVGLGLVVAGLVWIARRAIAARSERRAGCAVRHARPDRGDRRPVPRADGPSDFLRHPFPQSIRLALVRRRLDADRRPLSVVRARGRSAVRRIVDGGTAPECRHRSRVDGGQLRRPRGGAPAGIDARTASVRPAAPAPLRSGGSRTGCSTRGRARCRRHRRQPARAVSSSSWRCRRSCRRSAGA